MKECNKIILRPENPDDRKGILKNVADTVNDLIPDIGKSTANILKGIGGQTNAKASKIKARAYKDIAEIQLANQKLIDEREEKIRQSRLQQDLKNKEHQARMYALETERLNSLTNIVTAIEKLTKLGCEVDIKAITQNLLSIPEGPLKD